jgi:hypothetical protein
MIIEFTRKYFSPHSDLHKERHDEVAEPRFIHIIISNDEELGNSKASSTDLLNLQVTLLHEMRMGKKAVTSKKSQQY